MNVENRTQSDMTCANCGHNGKCLATRHARFLQDTVTLKCQKCRFVWDASDEVAIQWADGSSIVTRDPVYCTTCETDCVRKASTDVFFEHDLIAVKCDNCISIIPASLDLRNAGELLHSP